MVINASQNQKDRVTAERIKRGNLLATFKSSTNFHHRRETLDNTVSKALNEMTEKGNISSSEAHVSKRHAGVFLHDR